MYSDYFNKPKPYRGQEETMVNIEQALHDGHVVLFEGACGTGKTISSLAPALSVAVGKDMVVVIATSVKQQLDQFIIEARSINNKNPLKTIVLKSKMESCALRYLFNWEDIVENNETNIIKLINIHFNIMLEQPLTIEKISDSNTIYISDKRNRVSLHLDSKEKKAILTINKKSPHKFNAETENGITRLYGDENFVDYESCQRKVENTRNLVKTIRKQGMEYYDVNLATARREGTNICEPFLRFSFNVGGVCDSFDKWIYEDVRTPEEVFRWSVDHNTCGVHCRYASMPDALLVICNYIHILDPQIRKNVLIDKTGKGLDRMIVVFDEAHNIESKSRDLFTWQLSDSTIVQAVDNELRVPAALLAIQNPQENQAKLIKLQQKIEELHDPEVNSVEELVRKITLFLEHFKMALDTVCTNWEAEDKKKSKKTLNPPYDVEIVNPELRNDYREDRFVNELRRIVGNREIQSALPLLQLFGSWYTEFNDKSKCEQIFYFMTKYYTEELYKQREYFPYVTVESTDKNVNKKLILYNILPKIGVGYLLNNLWSAVLMSATLQPFDVLKTVLGIEKPIKCLTSPLSFPPERRKTFTITSPTSSRRSRHDVLLSRTRKNHEENKFIPNESDLYIQRSLESVISSTPGNVLIFFQTEKEVNHWYPILERSTTQLGVELLGHIRTSNVDNLKSKFFNNGSARIKTVLLTYIYGTLSEGVDFKDDFVRSVVVVGFALPPILELPTIAIKTCYEHEFGQSNRIKVPRNEYKCIGFDYSIKIPTLRKVRQAVGRCVRSPDDYGVRVLIDRRFASDCSSECHPVYFDLPPDEQKEIIPIFDKDVEANIRDFFQTVVPDAQRQT